MPKAKPHPHLIEQIIAAFDPEKVIFTTADGATVGPGDSVWSIDGVEYGVTGGSRIKDGVTLDILGTAEKQAISLRIGDLYGNPIAAMQAKLKVLLAELSAEGRRQKAAMEAGMRICDEIHAIEQSIKAALADAN